MREVGIRGFRAGLKQVLDEVERGETVLLTRGGKPIARVEPLHPAGATMSPGMARLLASGRVTWNGKPLTVPTDPVPLIGEGPTISDMIVQERDYSVERHFLGSGAMGDAVPGQ